jgi:RNA polymerase sigma-70 factor (ECF subfamily)
MGDSLAIAKAASPSQGLDVGASGADERIRCLVLNHYTFVWRLMRRLGVPSANAEDATQDVFIVADRKLQTFWPSNERSFLYALAMRIAANRRRTERRHPEFPEAELLAELPDSAPGADALLDTQRARAMTDLILETMPFEQRVVFVLFEIEDLSATEIAELLQIPSGTVASRLRRGRELFYKAVSRLEAQRVRVGVP